MRSLDPRKTLEILKMLLHAQLPTYKTDRK